MVLFSELFSLQYVENCLSANENKGKWQNVT